MSDAKPAAKKQRTSSDGEVVAAAIAEVADVIGAQLKSVVDSMNSESLDTSAQQIDDAISRSTRKLGAIRKEVAALHKPLRSIARSLRVIAMHSTGKSNARLMETANGIEDVDEANWE
jgi:hypothetical protein